jgi:hypothetical protein
MLPIHYIEWLDHCSADNRWMQVDRLAASNFPAECVSVGHIIAEDEDTLTICGTWTPTLRKRGVDEVKADQTIIKSCITRRRRLHLK